MSRRNSLIAVLGLLLAFTAACTNKKSVNPLADIGSKQPDKVLFDKAMDAMRHNRFDVARLQLQTLINTYPDSEFIARAKLAVGDSWYAEGGTAALAQAEQEYNDFITFFPNMPEAAEAQLKIANIHYQQMEKADRDYTHAKRAEDEYRKVILQYPDSKLVPEAKRKLLEVQEVLANASSRLDASTICASRIPRRSRACSRWWISIRCTATPTKLSTLLGQNYEGQIARLRLTPTCDVHGLPPRLRDRSDQGAIHRGIHKRRGNCLFEDSDAVSDNGSIRRCQEAPGGIEAADSAADQSRGGTEQGRGREPTRSQREPEADGHHQERPGRERSAYRG